MRALTRASSRAARRSSRARSGCARTEQSGRHRQRSDAKALRITTDRPWHADMPAGVLGQSPSYLRPRQRARSRLRVSAERKNARHRVPHLRPRIGPLALALHLEWPCRRREGLALDELRERGRAGEWNHSYDTAPCARAHRSSSAHEGLGRRGSESPVSNVHVTCRCCACLELLLPSACHRLVLRRSGGTAVLAQ